jgi:hypothetical protein
MADLITVSRWCVISSIKSVSMVDLIAVLLVPKSVSNLGRETHVSGSPHHCTSLSQDGE